MTSTGRRRRSVFGAVLDAAGKLVALECKVVSAAARPPSDGPGGPPFFVEAVADALYQIPNFRVTGLNKDLGIRFGFWRSVNHSHNPFMFEGFIDELARRGGPRSLRVPARAATTRPGGRPTPARGPRSDGGKSQLAASPEGTRFWNLGLRRLRQLYSGPSSRCPYMATS